MSGGGIERGREGATGEGAQRREGNFKGGIPRTALASVGLQYIHKTSHNAALSHEAPCPFEYLGRTLCIAIRQNVLFDRWIT